MRHRAEVVAAAVEEQPPKNEERYEKKRDLPAPKPPRISSFVQQQATRPSDSGWPVAADHDVHCSSQERAQADDNMPTLRLVAKCRWMLHGPPTAPMPYLREALCASANSPEVMARISKSLWVNAPAGPLRESCHRGSQPGRACRSILERMHFPPIYQHLLTRER